MHKDIIRIAGAGLAGLSAALKLAQNGFSVEVFEKEEDSGKARIDDWDVIENWTTEEDMIALVSNWGLTPDFEYRPASDFEMYVQDGDCYPVTTRRPLLYLIKRGTQPGSIEQRLKQQAQEAGVQIYYNHPARRDEVDIWATGSQRNGFFLGVGMSFHTHHPDTFLTLVSSSIAPKAYAYLIIAGGLGTLSVVLTEKYEDARAHLNHSIEMFQHIKRFEMEDMRMTSGFHGLPIAFRQPEPGAIAIGEAAGLQDFLWGFGIRHALYSGYLSGRAINEGLNYTRLVSENIHPIVRSSIINRMIYDLAGERTKTAMMRKFVTSPNLHQMARDLYRKLGIRQLLWPIALRRYEAHLAEPIE